MLDFTGYVANKVRPRGDHALSVGFLGCTTTLRLVDAGHAIILQEMLRKQRMGRIQRVQMLEPSFIKILEGTTKDADWSIVVDRRRKLPKHTNFTNYEMFHVVVNS